MEADQKLHKISVLASILNISNKIVLVWILILHM